MTKKLGIKKVYFLFMRYYIRVIIRRSGLSPNVTQTRPFLVMNTSIPPQISPVKIDVGVDDCLHLEVRLNKKWYHLNDSINGTITFMTNLLKLRKMQLQILRREVLCPKLRETLDEIVHTTVTHKNNYLFFTTTSTLAKVVAFAVVP